MNFPLLLNVVGITYDSMSFENIDLETEVEIPCGFHVGAFGAVRKFDVHKGIDLYAPHGSPVFSIEDGIVVDIRPFTGETLGYPWWNETQAVSVEGKSGVIVYGEIDSAKEIKKGMEVTTGTQLGTVLTVLKKDKGRPMSMLHLALHRHNVLSNGKWRNGLPQPSGLLDPTNLVIKAWQSEFDQT